MKLVHDIENDLEHTIPPLGGLDSVELFAVMTRRCLHLLRAGPGEAIVDLACGMGQDTLAIGAAVTRNTVSSNAVSSIAVSGPAEANAAEVTFADPMRTRVLGVEPSNRMIGWGRHWQRQRDASGEPGASPVRFVRALAEELPLRSASVDGLLCKGALDHFMDPALALGEIARVLRPGGRAVIALANYDSLSCRLGRWLHRAQTAWRFRSASPQPGRAAGGHPYFEPPPDHLTRFGYREIVALARPPLRLERVEGISLLWNFPPWAALLRAVPPPVGRLLVSAALAIAGVLPRAADVVIVRVIKP